jgi:ribose transport system ATP-binding protein
MSDTPVLSIQNVGKRFGATQALSDVSLDARGGEVLALIGENGAGKSTLMKILSGALKPDEGTIHLTGKPFAPSGPHEARTAGVAMIYQELNLAPDLSVMDNVMLGQELHTAGLVRRGEQSRRVRDALALLGHGNLDLDTPVRDLPIGLQQLVEIARALVFDARVIMFDEPTSSLTKPDAEHLFEVIARLKRSGRAILYVSHFLEEIRAVADRYTVLRDGRSVGSGLLAEKSEAEIIALMVGRSVDDLFPRVPHHPGEPILSLEGLTGRGMPRDVSFFLRRGEILGIAGLVGSGRTELLRAIYGLDAVRSGQVKVADVVTSQSPQARIRAGLGLVSEDRKTEGLAQDRSIADNLTLSRLQPYSRGGWLNLRRRHEAVEHWMQTFAVKARSPEQTIGELSGGNQQKVAIARLLHQQADVLLLDEPTRGIDVGTKVEIYRILGQLAAEGKAIIFVSSYLPELLAMCDSIGVMSRGRLRAIRPVDEWTQESVMATAVGGEA